MEGQPYPHTPSTPLLMGCSPAAWSSIILHVGHTPWQQVLPARAIPCSFPKGCLSQSQKRERQVWAAPTGLAFPQRAGLQCSCPWGSSFPPRSWDMKSPHWPPQKL